MAFNVLASQRKIKTIKNFEIKQQSQVTCLDCVMDETMCGEPMPLKVIDKTNGKLKFLYRKNSFLTLGFEECNAMRS